MALSKGKKILIAVVAGVVAIATTIGVVLGIQNSKDPGPDIPSIDTPVDPTPDTPVDPTPDDPVDPTPDDPVDPDPDTPVDPDPGEEDPGTSEKSEEKYRQDNIKILKEILAREYNQFTKTEYANYNLQNIDNIILNPAAGEVYFTADMSGITGSILGNYNFTGYLGQSFDWQSQEELNKFLISFNDSESDMTFGESKGTMSSKISEETYNKFVDYVKEQSYDGVDFSAVSDSDIFGVTWFVSDNDAYGYNYIEYKIVNNGKVYTLHMEWFPPMYSPDESIEEIITNKYGVFKVVDVQPFEEFDINTEIGATAQAQSEFSRIFRKLQFLKTKPRIWQTQLEPQTQRNLGTWRLSFQQETQILNFKKQNRQKPVLLFS